MPAHDFQDDDAPMRRSRIAQLVDRIDDRIRRRIAADRIVRSPNIVVDRPRQPHDGNAMLLAQERSTAQTAVTADDDEPFDALFLEPFVSLRTSFRRHEPMAARCTEESAAALDDIANILPFHLEHLAIQNTAIPVMDAPHFCPFKERRAHDGTCRRVHTRTVAATR